MYDLHTDINENDSQLERHFILHGIRSMVDCPGAFVQSIMIVPSFKSLNIY